MVLHRRKQRSRRHVLHGESLESRRLLDSTVVFNEIMYNPRGPDEMREWIELHNQMTVDAELSNWRLAEGVEYRFPAGTILPGGGYLVIAADPSAIQAAYGIETVLGPISGRLSNGGERLELRNHTERLMNSLDYEDGSLAEDTWPAGADGTGASLAKRTPQSASEDPANWTVSAQLGGTPGAANALTIESIKFAELMSVDHPWRFNQSGLDLGTEWRKPGFDDSEWPLGAGLLYAATSRLPANKKTLLKIGPTTYYFRTEFEITGELQDPVLRLNHFVDDGAIFYLNGQEVLRFRMPEGPINSETLASRSTATARLVRGELIDPSLLRQGLNSLAVEVHQSSLRSQDIVFGMELFLKTNVQTRAAADLIQLTEVAAAGDDFWVEIANTGQHPISVQGWQLTDTSGSTYILPNQMIEAKSQFVVQRATIGFSPSAGKILLLVAEDGRRVIDFVRIADRPRARSISLDGRWQYPRVTTPGKENQFGTNNQIVINEIMYHHRPRYAEPPNGANHADPAERPGNKFLESDEEWIELYNRSSTPVNLADWQLADAVRFSFPTDTILKAGEYGIVAGNARTLAAKYPTARILGEFAGRLSNVDERIQLLDRNQNIADEVHYFEGGYWPEFTDGGGSSLELLDPDADNARAAAWAASQETRRSSWQQVRYVRTVEPQVYDPPVNFNDFMLGLLDAGEVWIDNLSLREIGAEGRGPELIQNGRFDTDVPGAPASKWRIQGTHALSEVITDPEDLKNKVLRLVAVGRMNYLSNHAETTLAGNTAVEHGKSYEISYDAKWITGSPQLHTEIHYQDAARTTILVQPNHSGTPGAQNSSITGSVRAANLGPTMFSLAHAPVVPVATQPVTVSVNAQDTDGMDDIRVLYRLDGDDTFSEVPMTLDRARHYAATLPALPNDSLVQFYVQATDGLGAVSVFPPAGPYSRALYRVDNSFEVHRERHDLQLLMMDADTRALHAAVNMMDNQHRGTTVIYDGSTVFYDVGTRLRGSMFSRQYEHVTGYNVRFRSDQLFRGVHDSITFDQGGKAEIVVKFMNTQSGNLGGSYDDVFQLTTPSRLGDGPSLVGLARQSDIFLKEQFGQDRGTVFKMKGMTVLTSSVGGNPEGLKLYQPIRGVGEFDIQDLGDDKELYRWPYLITGNRARDDYADVIAMAKAIGAPAEKLERAVADVLDIDSWARTFAVMSLFAIGDTYSQGSPHNLIFYAPANGGKVMAFPWDWDHVFRLRPGAPIHGNKNISKVWDLPTYEHFLLGHMHDLMSTVYNREYLMPWVQHFGKVLDEDFSWLLTNVDERHAFLRKIFPTKVPFVASSTAFVNTVVSADSPATVLVPSTDNGGATLGDSWTQTEFAESPWTTHPMCF